MDTRKRPGRAGLVVGVCASLLAWCATAVPVAAQDYSGEWITNPLSYTCPAAQIGFDGIVIHQSGSSLTVVPGGPDPGPLHGGVDAAGNFHAEAQESFPCGIDYQMHGTFLGPARMQAAFDVDFSFVCGACGDQHWTLFAWRVWADWGHALAGTHGAPALTGTGTLQAGQPVSLSLTGARENAGATLVIGVSVLQATFKGGVMVPDPDLLILGLTTGPAGTLDLASNWPPGLPSGFTSYFQFWIDDPAGPLGYAASNGVSATTP